MFLANKCFHATPFPARSRRRPTIDLLTDPRGRASSLKSLKHSMLSHTPGRPPRGRTIHEHGPKSVMQGVYSVQPQYRHFAF